MELSPIDKLWPSVPVELKYVGLRLPGTFRELVADRRLTNDEVGRIIRCIALNSDFFMTPRIEPEVFYYRKVLADRELTRKRVEEHRKRKKSGSGGVDQGSCGQDGQSVTNEVTVTKLRKHEDEAMSVTPIPVTKTPPNVVEKTPPIVPLEKTKSSPLESAPKKRRARTRREVVADGLARDLFDFVASNGATGSALASTGRRQEGAQEASVASGGTTTIQDIETRPEGSGTPNAAAPAVATAGDSRVDAAWIPQKFAVFWSKYPKKVAKSDAVRAFTKLIKAQPDVDKFMSTLMASLEWWKSQSSWTKDGGKFIPYPASWLNGGHWEDSAENNGTPVPKQAEFLGGSETDEELLKRMMGG